MSPIRRGFISALGSYCGGEFCDPDKASSYGRFYHLYLTLWHFKTAQFDSFYLHVSYVFFAGLQSVGSTAVVIDRLAPNTFKVMD